MTKWSRSVGRHDRRKIYAPCIIRMSSVFTNPDQSLPLSLSFLYLCFVLLAFLFLLHKTQHNSTHRTPNNGVTNNHFLFIVGDSAEKIPRGYPHTIYERQTFFWTYLPLFTLTYSPQLHTDKPLFFKQRALLDPHPPLFILSNHLAIRPFFRFVCSTGRWKVETGNNNLRSNTTRHTKDTHK